MDDVRPKQEPLITVDFAMVRIRVMFRVRFRVIVRFKVRVTVMVSRSQIRYRQRMPAKTKGAGNNDHFSHVSKFMSKYQDLLGMATITTIAKNKCQKI